MMTDIHSALFAFWSGFGMRAFLSGHVPQDGDGNVTVDFPYITFEVVNADALEGTVTSAISWHRAQNGVNVNLERARLLDAVASAIPPEGKRIDVPGGFLMLYRNGAGFQDYFDDPEDRTVIGGRTSYEVRYYTI